MFLIREPISSRFFLLGLIFIPFFSDFPLFTTLSMSFLSPSILFMFISIIFYIFEIFYSGKTKFKVCNAQITLMLFFISILALSTLFNFNKSAYLVGTGITGISTMLSGAFSMLVILLITVFFIQVFNTISIYKIQRYIIFGFLLNCGYVGFEFFDIVLPNILGFQGFYITDSIGSFFHDRPHDIGVFRVRGLSYEPSYHILVLFFVLPFIISDVKQKFYLKLWIICLILTFSPTGFLGALIFIILYVNKGIKLYLFLFLCMLFIFIGIFYFLELDYSSFNSTLTRFGSLIAVIKLIMNNLLFGVGPDMVGYWITYYYPDFFYISQESSRWMVNGQENFNNPSFNVILSLIANVGILPILGLLIYLYKYRLYKYIFTSRLARASIISMLIVSCAVDTISFFGFWIFFVLTITKKWHLLDKK